MALTDKLTNIANAIRGKTGGTDSLTLEQMVTEIEGIGGGSVGDDEWFNDGDTHIWITLHDGRTSPMLGVCPNGTVTVDWGDGTTPDVLTGTSTYAIKWTPTHEYAKPGDYVIRLTVNGKMGVIGSSSSSGSYILCHTSGNDGRNFAYRNAVRKVEIGNGVPNINEYAFHSCYSMKSVLIPVGVTSIEKSAFQYCNSLESVIIPEGVTRIRNSAFSYCRALRSVVIPEGVTNIESEVFEYCASLASVVIQEGVTSISDYAFRSCTSLPSVVIPKSVTDFGNALFTSCTSFGYFDFSNYTAVPSLPSTNVFANIPADCEIRVPAALYDEWIAATNWSTYASYIKAV